jgi:hypothetical protein
MSDFSDPNPVGKDTGLQLINSSTNKRRFIRASKSPLDKCTIVSILPKDIDEYKWTVYPNSFRIKAGTYENPSTLIVHPSSWWSDVDIEKPVVEVLVSSIQMADSVIRDYCNGMLGCDMDNAMPGLFFVLGECKVDEIKLKYKTKIEQVKVKQDNWFKVLVKLADSLWARANGNPLAISDEMRLAARSLNLNDKAWLRDFQIAELVRCAFCGGMRNANFPICPTCKAIDPAHPLSKDIKFAV